MPLDQLQTIAGWTFLMVSGMEAPPFLMQPKHHLTKLPFRAAGGALHTDISCGSVLVARTDSTGGALRHLGCSTGSFLHPRPTYLLDAQMIMGTYAYFDLDYAMGVCATDGCIVLIASAKATCRNKG